MINNGVDEWFTIYYQNASAGEIHLVSTFAPEGGDAYEQLQAQYQEQNERLQQELAEANAKAEEMASQQEQLKAQLEAAQA